MQLGKESLKKFSPAGIHTHTHNLLTTEIHEVSFPPQRAGASRGGNKRAEITTGVQQQSVILDICDTGKAL